MDIAIDNDFWIILKKEFRHFKSYLKDYDVRFLGTDYLKGGYTGKDIPIDIVWLGRDDHDYSSTRMKKLIYESVKEMGEIDYD